VGDFCRSISAVAQHERIHADARCCGTACRLVPGHGGNREQRHAFHAARKNIRSVVGEAQRPGLGGRTKAAPATAADALLVPKPL
jgi:hypothetical protein